MGEISVYFLYIVLAVALSSDIYFFLHSKSEKKKGLSDEWHITDRGGRSLGNSISYYKRGLKCGKEGKKVAKRRISTRNTSQNRPVDQKSG
jgi:hypothetical protein